MRNTFILGGGLASALLLAACAGGERQPQQKPLNIIHIMTDDHSYQTISAYGHALGKLAPTPNLDRLAAEGMLFRKAFVENSLSTPSRACLMTGLYSHQNGQRQLGAGIDTTKTFFSEILRQHGYQTGVVGKWHMRCEPKGFDFYHVFDDQGEYYNPRFKSPETNGEYVREEGYATTLTTDHAIEFLDQRDPDKPFCLLVHHKAPHRNWMPDTKYANLYEDVEFPMPETFYDDYSTRCDAARTQEMRIDDDMTMVYDLKVDELKTTDAYKNERELGGWNASIDRMTPEQREAWMAAYKPNNEKMLAQGLKGDDLVRWKYQRYIKDYVRCIKSIDDEVGRLIAYLDLAGIEKPDYMVGTSLVPLFDGTTPADWREYLYYHYYDYPAYHQVRRHDGVRDKRYKLIHFYGEKDQYNEAINCDELYDLEKDPNELNNLYGKAEYKEVSDRLQQRLDQFRRDLKVDEY